MRKLFTPTFRISLGLAGLTISFIAGAFALGLLPNEREMKLESRIATAEALAVQFTVLAAQDDTALLHSTVADIVQRNESIHALTVRNSNRRRPM